MELTIAATLALVSCFYLSLTTSPVSGYSSKCSGKWRIHACLGGNGKRSDPDMSPEKIQPSLLHRVLISDAQQLNRILQETPQTSDDSTYLSPFDDGSYKSVSDDDFSQPIDRSVPEVRALRQYLEALKIQRALREGSEDLM